ncbi:hypothetical protein Hanom_Chr06g00555201 [Helianthus anomalus]
MNLCYIPLVGRYEISQNKSKGTFDLVGPTSSQSIAEQKNVHMILDGTVKVKIFELVHYTL